MSAVTSRSRGTAPTSLQQASGGVLAEWLLRSTSTRPPSTSTTRPPSNSTTRPPSTSTTKPPSNSTSRPLPVPCQQADASNADFQISIGGATLCSDPGQERTTVAAISGKNVIDERKIKILKSGCMDIKQNVDLVNQDETVFTDEVCRSKDYQNVNHKCCTCNDSFVKCTCKETCGHLATHQSTQRYTLGYFDTQTPCSISKQPKEVKNNKLNSPCTTVLSLSCSGPLFGGQFHSTKHAKSKTLPKLTNTSSKETHACEHDDEFQSKCKRCRLSDTPDQILYGGGKMLRHLKSDVETRAYGYFNVVKKHMPESWLHSTFQNALDRLSFRSKFIDDRGSLSLWIIDLLTILRLCQLTNFQTVSLDFPSFTFDILIKILSLIDNFELSQPIRSISLPFDENETVRSHRFHHYTSQSEKNSDFSKSLSKFPAIVKSFVNLKSLCIRSSNDKLLRCLQNLNLTSLSLTSSNLKNRTILKSFLGTGDDWHRSDPTMVTAFDMHGKLLSSSLQTLHIPNCKVSMLTYRSLIQLFPNLTDLQVKPKLELLNQSVSDNLNESSDTHQNSPTHLKCLALTCNELSFLDIKSHFPSLQQLSVQVDNVDALHSLSVVNELHSLKTLQLKCRPKFTHFYRNIVLDGVYPFLKKTFESLTTLSLQNFDISPDSFNMLSTLPKLTSLKLKSCWIKASDNSPKQVPMFKALTELHLTSIPARSAANCLFSSCSIQHLTLQPQNTEMHVSVTTSTERSLRDLLSSGNLASLETLSISSCFLSQTLVQQLSLLPRLQKVTTIEQSGTCADDLFRFVSKTPSHITFCSES